MTVLTRAGLVVVAVVAIAGAAQPSAAQNGDPKSVVTRTYDVRDLLVGVGDYPLPEHRPPADVAAATRPSPAEADKALRTAHLQNLILNTIDSDTWRDNGGSVGSMQALDGQLIVTHWQPTHDSLAALLRQVRRARGRMVRVTLTWVQLQPGELTGLAAAGAGQDAGIGVQVLDPAAWAKLPPDAVACRVQSTSFPLQTINVRTGPPSSGGGGVFGNSDGTSRPPPPRAAVQLTATLLEGLPAATLDVRATVTAGAAEQAIESAVQVPLDKPTVLAGGSTAPAPDGSPRELYLVAQVSAPPPPPPPAK